jgi:hypothetical protein
MVECIYNQSRVPIVNRGGDYVLMDEGIILWKMMGRIVRTIGNLEHFT